MGRVNERKPCSPTEWLTGVWVQAERNRREERTEGECSARADASLSEGGSPKRNPEGDVGDLCSMHKGLAQFFDIWKLIGSKCMKRT